MAKNRIVKQHDERMDEILRTAQELFYSQGYENTSIQMIIDRIDIAKGTFYHYFSSKDDLLSAMTERVCVEVVDQVAGVVDGAGGTAIDKINRFYGLSTEWKMANVDTVIASTKALYDDRNLLLRSRLAENSIRFLSPILTAYIKQGVDEGLFFPSDPDHIGEVMLRLKVAIGERVMPMFFEIKDHPEHAEEISIGFSLYQDSVERLLGVKPGTLNIFDPAEFKEKFGSR